MRQTNLQIPGCQITTRKILRLLPLLLLIPVGLAGCATSAPDSRPRFQAPTVPFNRLFYTETSGRVGYHLDSDIQVYEDDTPAGFPCSFISDYRTYEGNLPPGLEWDADSANFGGTPRQPGNWTASITLHGIHCSVGGDTNYYGDRTVNIRFTVSP